MSGFCDSFERPINYLRVSVTDRCNLRCVYCMPAEGVRLVPEKDILSYEEICSIVKVAASLGISKVRLTGGEPLVRTGLVQLVKMLAQINGIDDISLTTNGVLLAEYAAELKTAGLSRVNVSLDTLRRDKFRCITRHGNLDDVLKGMEAARAAGLNPVKINMVVMRDVNDQEIVDFAAKTISEGWHVRFIEYMPFLSEPSLVLSFVSAKEIKRRLAILGELEPCTVSGNGPARYFRLPKATGTIGFITPLSHHFCFSCNRIRLTADGRLLPCLLDRNEVDLRSVLRNGVSPEGLRKLIEGAIAGKPLHHHLAEGILPCSRVLSQIGG